MKHQWTSDPTFPDDFDLSVQDAEGHWVIIAFIRWRHLEQHYQCMFMGMEDGKYPDGETFTTKRGAQQFCTKHLPVMWIRHNANTGEES
jgi:hypothetical protein